jgi:uncharacterized protein (DUF849 family)
MIVQACLNGARAPGFHPALPLTPAQLAQEAAAAVAAGAAEIHMHPRGADGAQSLDPGVIGAAIAAVRARLPGTLVGVSTGAWIEGDQDRTLACVGGWAARPEGVPDYASVNLAEAAAPALFERLHRGGIGVEAGLASVADAERLLALDLGRRCLRILVEIRGDDADISRGDDADMSRGDNADTLRETAAAVLARLAAAGLHRAVLQHGFDAGAWPLVRMAAARGLSTRIGLEDADTLPDGSRAEGNAALVAAACRLLRPA